jgi:hypothetical protein
MPTTTDIGRNDPCPCGSGTKYKRCCLGTEEDPQGAPKKMMPALVVLISGLVLAVVVLVMSGAENGALVAVVTLMFAGGTYVFTNMPPPNSSPGSPGGINFGG